jgi:hypothetical protein
MSRPDLLTREDLRDARMWFTVACARSRAHSAIAAAALREYGDHGPDISGCVRTRFPAGLKAELRALAHQVGWASDRAYRWRPKGVHWTTMRALAHAVAERDGCGFYRP